MRNEFHISNPHITYSYMWILGNEKYGRNSGKLWIFLSSVSTIADGVSYMLTLFVEYSRGSFILFEGEKKSHNVKVISRLRNVFDVGNVDEIGNNVEKKFYSAMHEKLLPLGQFCGSSINKLT